MSGLRHHPDIATLWSVGVDTWERLEDLVSMAGFHTARALEAGSGPVAKDAHLLEVEYLAEAAAQAERMLGRACRSANAAGASWQAIGAQLGTTRQAAHQRFAGAGLERERASSADNLPRLCCEGAPAVYRGQRCPSCLEVMA